MNSRDLICIFLKIKIKAYQVGTLSEYIWFVMVSCTVGR